MDPQIGKRSPFSLTEGNRSGWNKICYFCLPKQRERHSLALNKGAPYWSLTQCLMHPRERIYSHTSRPSVYTRVVQL